MSPIIDYIKPLIPALVAILFACVGGFIRSLQSNEKKFSLFSSLSSILIAGFAGFLVWSLFIAERDFSSVRALGIYAITGYCGDFVIYAISDKFKSHFRDKGNGRNKK